jgi:hypothetical protein
MYIQLKKFYDPAIAEPAAAVIEPAQSVAALMARHGVTNNTDQMVATPVLINPEKKEEPTPAPEVSPAATATEPSSAEPANPEPLPQQPEPTPAPQPPIAAEPVSPPTLQEVLKQHQPGAILKELGYDETVVNELKELDPKMIAFLTHWKTNGDVTQFLREATTDYTKMPAEEVMRHQLRQEYPTATPQQLEALYKREVVKAYSLDSEEEEERNEGLLLLGAKADKYRESFLKNQQNFLLPKPPEPKATPEPDPQEQAKLQQYEAYKLQVKESTYTKNIFATKQISIGEGDEKFNFPVEPEGLTEILLDDEKWAESLFEVRPNPDGSKNYIPDVEKQMLVAAVMKYGKTFLNKYADHYKAIGAKAIIAPIENATPPANSTPAASQAPPNSPAEAMARSGRLV